MATLVIKYTLIIFVLLCIEVTVAETSSNISFMRLNQSELESLDGIFAIAQDKQGFLWFAGKNGLRRYDGYKVDIFRHNPQDPSSISSNDISDLYVDKAGRLWVALLSGGGLNQFDYETQTFIHYIKNSSDPNSIGSADIYAFAEDENGDLWLSTHDNGLNRLEHSTGHFHRYPISLPGTKDSGVRDIAIDKLGNIWAATNSQGLYKINKSRDQFIHYPHNSEDINSLSDNNLHRVFIDRYENIWVGTHTGGINKLDQTKGQFIQYKHDPKNEDSISSGMILDIAEDAKGDLWVATDSALNRYDKWKNSFEKFTVDHYGINTLSGKILRMFLDSSGDFWLGGQLSTVNRISDRGAKFKVLSHNPVIENSLSSMVVTALIQDSKSNIWVGSENGLTKVNSDGKTFERFYHEDDNKNSLVSNNIFHLMMDTENKIWVCTDTGMSIYDPVNNQFSNVDSKITEVVGQTRIKDMLQDKENYIWIATQGNGLIQYHPKTKEMVVFRHNRSDSSSLSHDYVWSLQEDKKGVLWVGTLWGLNKFNRENNKFQSYYYDSEMKNSLSNNSVRAITEDNNGNLWLGTTSGLSKYDMKKGTFDVYRVAQGLPDDNITSVVIDNKNNVWLTTQKGISRLDVKKNIFKNYDIRHGIASSSYPNKAATLLKDNGDILFASAMGMTLVKPSDVTENSIVPPVVLTDLYVNNEIVKIKTKGLLEKHLSLTQSIVLTHQQNNFSVEFSALNFHIPSLNQYQYKLVGFDDVWRNTHSSQRRASYTNLNSGNYTLLVKGSNNDELWNETPVQLQISILAPWWQRIWALLGYCLIFILMVVIFLNIINKQMKKNKNIEKRLKNIDKLKKQFLSNISKDILLPINTISGLTENLLENSSGNVSEKARQHLLLISENSHQLEMITRDMLDFSSHKSDGTQLNIRHLYLEPILEGIVKWFQPQAEEKSLKLYLTVEGDLPEVEADYSCIQKILFNLIDNAIKHTLHGYVDVIARQVEDSILIQIADTGMGIGDTKRESIFEISGIQDIDVDSMGLSYTKKLVELHGGTIYVDSSSNKGSMFVIRLPLKAENILNNE